mgnify:CR=1 FL=1
MPPSVDELRNRLVSRATDSAESIEARIERAKYEIDQAPLFDVQIINDDLVKAVNETESVILAYQK